MVKKYMINKCKMILNYLIFFLLAIVTQNVLAAWDHTKVKTYKGCVKCHEKQVEVWEKTEHFKTFKTLTKKKEAKAIAKAMGVNPKKIKKHELCAGCHFTIADKEGKKKAVSGVSCESCHGPSADWLKLHNDFGGKGVKKKYEAPEHRKEREAKQNKLGMIYPGNIYGFAKNCYSCHIVPNEKLVNDSKHAAGSKFNFVKRTQGDIRHGEKATPEEKRKMQVIGYAVELELSSKALANAKNAGKRFTDKMRERNLKALANLQDINSKVNDADIAKIIAAAGKVGFNPGEAGLNNLVKTIASAAQHFSSSADGAALAALDGRKEVDASKAKVASGSSAPAVVAKAPEPKPAPVAKPVEKPKKVDTPPKPVAVAAPEPKPVPKPKPAPRVESAPVAIPKPVVAAPVLTKPKVAVPKAESPKPVVASKPAPAPVEKTKVAKVTPAPTPSTKPVKPVVALIKAFNIMTPSSKKLCGTNNPWLLGEKAVGENDRLSSDGCLSLRYTAASSASIYIFNQTKDGKLIQLLPNSCKALGIGPNKVSANQQLNIPQDSRKQPMVIGLDDSKGIEWFYAVAVTDSAAESQLQQQIKGVADVCDENAASKFKIDIKQFQAGLTRINAESNGQLQWEGRRFIHD